MQAKAIVLAALVLTACSGRTETLADKLQGTWIDDSSGYTMQFDGDTLREGGNLGGASQLQLTTHVTYKEPDVFEKPGGFGGVFPWRVVFKDRNHIDIYPPNGGMFGTPVVDHYTRR